ncbi:hypothetical protein BJ742DRAFT_854391 [Cladochytrium replicatum]|nr:hypothetical protein BJ742DRAFT_854391 [Cladochytrium replicatum]
MAFILLVFSVLAAALMSAIGCFWVAYRNFEAIYGPPPIPPDSRTFEGINREINPVIPEDAETPPIGARRTYAVIGGGGFLGSYVVYRLLRTRNINKVYVLDLSIGMNGWLYEGRSEVEFIRTDITHRESVKKIVAETKAEVVFYTAAVIRYYDILPSQYVHSHKVNVEGTENVLRACDEAPSVKYLVHMSSAAVTQGWDRSKGKFWDLNEEEACITKRNFSHYGTTKALAEQKVRSWDGPRLRCVSLRPFGIYGCGDLRTVTSFLQPITPYNHCIMNWDYVENVAQAMIVAADALESVPEKVSGRAFYICDGHPVDSFAFGKSFKKLRPQMSNFLLVPRFVFFMLCAIGEAAQLLGLNLPGELKILNFGSFGSSQLSPTYVNDAALKAFGDWRRWSLEESIGRCVYLWELHQKKCLKKAKGE